jgi:hypothetical protein
MTQTRYFLSVCPERLRKTRKPSVRIAGVTTEIRTKYLPSISLERLGVCQCAPHDHNLYCLHHVVCSIIVEIGPSTQHKKYLQDEDKIDTTVSLLFLRLLKKIFNNFRTNLKTH